MQLKLSSTILLVASMLGGAMALCSGSNWAIGERILELRPDGDQWYYVYTTTPEESVVDYFTMGRDGNICSDPRIGCSPAPIFINKYISPAGIVYNCFRDPVEEHWTASQGHLAYNNRIQSCCRRA